MVKNNSAEVPRQFARVEGSPGAAPRLVGLLKAFWPFLIVFFLAGYLTRAAWPHPALEPVAVGFLFLLLAGGLAVLLVRSERMLSQFMKGARGEEVVARLLGFLPHSYRIFHGVELPRARGTGRGHADLDHIVIGPSGIFVVETKNWNGRIQLQDGEIVCDGKRPDRPPLEQVTRGARHLEAVLEECCEDAAQVQPVLCFTGSRIDETLSGAGGVIICNASTLLPTLRESLEQPPSTALQDQAAVFLKKAVR